LTTTVPDARLAVRGIEQRIRYDYSEPVRNVKQRLVVVPPPRHGCQRRVDWSIEVDGAAHERLRIARDTFGNVRVEVAIPTVTSWIEFVVRTTIAFDSDTSAPTRVPADSRYARPTRLTAGDDAIARLVAGAGRNGPESICRGVHNALTYEHDITDVHTTAAQALAYQRGVCQDYAHVMVAACRLAGLPARYVSGHLIGEGGSHAWVEVFVPAEDGHAGSTVEAWDPTHGRRTDDSYITIATGRDYADVAPMSGTFDGRAHGRLSVRKRAC
jgi:transglutaminase-like putative cysteine protease